MTRKKPAGVTRRAMILSVATMSLWVPRIYNYRFDQSSKVHPLYVDAGLCRLPSIEYFICRRPAEILVALRSPGSMPNQSVCLRAQSCRFMTTWIFPLGSFSFQSMDSRFWGPRCPSGSSIAEAVPFLRLSVCPSEDCFALAWADHTLDFPVWDSVFRFWLHSNEQQTRLLDGGSGKDLPQMTQVL